MPRRGESIYKRADGRWEARYIHHYEDGKAKYRYLYASTYAEVKAKRAAEIRLPEAVLVSGVKGSAKFSELASLWLLDVRGAVKESTYARYFRIVFVTLNTRLGDKRLLKLDPIYLKGFVRRLSFDGSAKGGPLAPKTVADATRVLKSIFKFGLANGYPCADLSSLTPPSPPRKKIATISDETRRRIVEIVWNDRKGENRVGLGVVFALYTGVRVGELCGLRGEDFDFNLRSARIERAVSRVSDFSRQTRQKTKIVVGTTKTSNSTRVVPLPSFLVELLRRYRIERGRYFLTGTEKPTEPRLFYLRYKTFMRKHGLETSTFHALRHSFATHCVEKGFDAKSLAEILGHANVSTTFALYVHPTFERKRLQMETLTPSYLSSKK